LSSVFCVCAEPAIAIANDSAIANGNFGVVANLLENPVAVHPWRKDSQNQRRFSSARAKEAESRDAVGRAYYEHGAAPGQGYRNGVRTGRLGSRPRLWPPASWRKSPWSARPIRFPAR
jgi:hypothetical protein